MSSALDRNPGYPPGCRLSDIDPRIFIPPFDATLERELRAHAYFEESTMHQFEQDNNGTPAVDHIGERDGGPASNMRLRDYFAAQAMQAMLHYGLEHGLDQHARAIRAYEAADAMIVVRGH